MLFNRLRIAALLDLFVACTLLFIAAAAALAANGTTMIDYKSRKCILVDKYAKVSVCSNFVKQFAV